MILNDEQFENAMRHLPEEKQITLECYRLQDIGRRHEQIRSLMQSYLRHREATKNEITFLISSIVISGPEIIVFFHNQTCRVERVSLLDFVKWQRETDKKNKSEEAKRDEENERAKQK